MSLSNFHYLYQDRAADQTLVLLHGTGGDEHDLLPLADRLIDRANLLSLRGNISENGLRRFFKRLDWGVFDEDNIRHEVKQLKDFLDRFSKQQQISFDQFTFLGYSNGANMILALLFLYPQLVRRAVLLHPMLPLQPGSIDLSGTNIILTYGQSDQMIVAADSQRVINTLRERGAKVQELAHPHGHEIRQEEVEFVKQALQKLIN